MKSLVASALVLTSFGLLAETNASYLCKKNDHERRVVLEYFEPTAEHQCEVKYYKSEEKSDVAVPFFAKNDRSACPGLAEKMVGILEKLAWTCNSEEQTAAQPTQEEVTSQPETAAPHSERETAPVEVPENE